LAKFDKRRFTIKIMLESSEGGARGAKYARVGDKVGSPPSPLVASLSV